MMRAVDVIRRARQGEPVGAQHLREFVAGVVRGEVPDYQAAAFLMAVYCRGASDSDTAALTLAMRDSGHVIDLKDVPGPKVDKHSTGGVGDKISLPLAPLVAACGVYVPMVSGRGLGHSGGTLDKLEAIPGFRVRLELEQFRRQVREIGVCMMGQTGDLAPADRIFYALRDVTATVESVPLITSSILSKKLAEGIDALVLDVKVGPGAFMKDQASARRLAASLLRVGREAGLRVRAVLTRMEAPLGRTIGNALEVVESIEILRGAGPSDTTELTLVLGGEMLALAGVVDDATEGKRRIRQAMMSGAGLEKMRELIAWQGGDPRVVDDVGVLPRAPLQTELLAPRTGRVHSVDSFVLAMATVALGGGRSRAEDAIDPAVGLEVLCRVGDHVSAGDPLVRVHHRTDLGSLQKEIVDAFTLEDGPPAEPPLVLDVL